MTKFILYICCKYSIPILGIQK